MKALLVYLGALACVGTGVYLIYPPAALITVGGIVLLDFFLTPHHAPRKSDEG